MNPLVLAPHGDDETLFAAFTCMRARAHVIICSQDANPETRRQRSLETTAAITILGCSHHEWSMPADKPDWDNARTWMNAWNSDKLVASIPETVYAPAVHPEGHEQHNKIGELALEVFGDKVVPYLTYAPRGQRQTDGREVVPTANEIERKLQALACYRSQIEHPSTRPWFFELLDLREWLG
jgi:LmbE family N-acetylglucosaminyl deacetylase